MDGYWYLYAILIFYKCYIDSTTCNMLHAFTKAGGLLLGEEDVRAAVEGVADEGFACMCRFGIICIPCSAPNKVTGGDVIPTFLLHVWIVVAIGYPMRTIVCLFVALMTMCSRAQPCFAHIIHKFRSIKLASQTTMTRLIHKTGHKINKPNLQKMASLRSRFWFTLHLALEGNVSHESP